MENWADDFDSLLGLTIPFATQMLEQYGEFFPFGGTVASDGSVVAASAFDDEVASPEQVYNLLVEGMREQAAGAAIRASAVVFATKFRVDRADDEFPAIALSLEHLARRSVAKYFLYTLESGKVNLFQDLTGLGKRDVFPSER